MIVALPGLFSYLFCNYVALLSYKESNYKFVCLCFLCFQWQPRVVLLSQTMINSKLIVPCNTKRAQRYQRTSKYYLQFDTIRVDVLMPQARHFKQLFLLYTVTAISFTSIRYLYFETSKWIRQREHNVV